MEISLCNKIRLEKYVINAYLNLFNYIQECKLLLTITFMNYLYSKNDKLVRSPRENGGG